MNIVKANWSTSQDTVRVTVPIEKVDKERRLVSGFATLDNIDNHNDVVLATASAGAFERFRGNIREMHQPIAVGVLKEFTEKSFYGPDGKPYNGVFVTVYVSKGAQDTWEKVLDGTLSGFSIGGEIRDSETTWVKDANANIRFIKEYDLVELSLVDNPANQLSNVVSIMKSDDGLVLKGMAVETTLVNVFWCDNDELATKSTTEFANCPVCNKSMAAIGWFEETENADEKVAETVDKFLRQKEESTDTDLDEGGVTVGKKDEEVTKAETVTKDNEVVEEDAAVDSDAAQAVSEDADVVAEEEAVSVDEAETDEADVAKMLDDLKASIIETVEKSKKDNSAEVDALKEQVAEFGKSLDEKTSEVLKKYDALSEQLNSIKETSSEVEKRLEVIESSTAVKKSDDGDGSESEKKVQKGLWGGTFFGG